MRLSADATRFVERVARGGIPHEARRAVHATLAALGEVLDETEKRRLASALPADLVAWLDERAFDRGAKPGELFERVARDETVTASEACERAQIVCGVIARALAPFDREMLCKHVPAELADLFRVDEPSEAPPHVHHPKHHVLATGDAGSAHPLSESAPPELVASHSVDERNPHADTKLSSSHGLTQEDTSESLATSKPKDARTIGRSSG